KIVKGLLFNCNRKMETYAILDDGSERTILLHSAAEELGLHGRSEELALRTIRQDVRAVRERSVSFSVASAIHPQKRFRIEQAFTASELGLSTHSYPVKSLQKAYHHLRDLPLHSFSQAQPLLLIGSDYPHLLTPVERVHLGPPGGLAALNTRLGWTLQGPFKVPLHQSSTPQCLLTGTHPPTVELPHHMAQPWQMDVLPSPNVKLTTRSKQDTATVRSQEEKTVRVGVDRRPHQALQQSVLGHRCGTGKRLCQKSIRAEARSKIGRAH